MTATTLRSELDGPDAGLVSVRIPWGCHTPRLAFLADDPRVLSQLLQSRRGAQVGLGGLIVSWTEGDVAIRVDLADRATEDFPPAPAAEPPVAPAAAVAAPAPTSRPVHARRRRRTSGTLNLSQNEIRAVESLIDLALETSTRNDADLLRAVRAKLERLPHGAPEAGQ